MAAKYSTCVNLKGIISVFKILSNTDRSKSVDLSLNFATTNSFDDLLMLNLHLLRYELENNESLKDFEELKTYLCGYFETKSSSKENKDSSNCTEIDETLTTDKYKYNKTTFSLSETRITSNKSWNVRWAFGQISLQALSCLKNTLRAIKTSENNAKSPAVDLSISDQQVVKTVIQLIVVLGICPNLLEGVGIPIQQRTGFSAALGSDQVLPKCPKCLYECVMMLVSCLSEPSLSLVILSKHLADILAALIQLGYCEEVCNSIDQSVDPVIEDDKKLKGASKLASQVDLVTLKSERQDSLTNEDIPRVSFAQNRSKQDGKIDGKLSSSSTCEGGIFISKVQQDKCKKALNNLINKMYQPLIIRELLFLQGSMSGDKTSSTESRTVRAGNIAMNETSPMPKESNTVNVETTCLKGGVVTRSPKWMKDVCGHLLSMCLMKKNGVQSVLRAVLEASSGAAGEWKICEAIAQVIANCPIQSQSPDEYYRTIAPQALTLLHLPSSKLQQQYSRASVLIIHAMLRKYPAIAHKYVAGPLIQPFLTATREPGSNSKMILVDEKELTRCIEGLHKVFVASPNVCQVLTESMEGIVAPVFELFCFVKHSASHVKTALLELLSTFFKRTNNPTAMTALYVFVCNEIPDTDYFKSKDPKEKGQHLHSHEPKITLMAKGCIFGYGEGGGVILQRDHPSETEKNGNPFGEMFGKAHEGYETRALCLVEVLQSLRKDEIPGDFFLYLLQQVQEMILKPNFREIGKMKALVIFNALALMCEKLGPSVLKNTGHMIQFIDTTLTRAHRVFMENEDTETGAFELDTLTMALGMLSALLGGAVKVEPSDYAKLEALTPILREISENHAHEEITEQANDLLVVILTKTTVLSEKTKRARTEENGDDKRTVKGKQGLDTDTHGSKWIPNDEMNIDLDFETAFDQLCDPFLPVRGHALMKLSSLLKSRDPKALAKVDILVKTFRDSLIHEDTYIYLAAIEGLVAAADVRSDDVIPYLAREFLACCGEEADASGSEEDKGEYRSFEKLNEKKSMVKRSSTTRLKVGESLVRAVKRCGQLVPRYFQVLIHAFLVGVRDEDSLIRASSLSNLGELCRLSPHVLPTALHEIFHCINTVLRSDEASEVRQGAVMVLTLVLKGLGQNTIVILSDKLKDIYQLLKYVESCDQDETTRIHALVALGELETIMRGQLFPEQQLVKHINILP